MDWLVPALIATSSMAILIAMVYLFLFYQEKEKFLMLWSVSWAVYSLRFLIHTGMVLKIMPPSFVVFQQIASLVSAFIFIFGTYIFLNKPFPKFWLYGTVLSIIWAIFSSTFSLSFAVTHIPVAFFIGSVFYWTGYSLIRTREMEGYGKHIVGWALILWGIHKADYPFLRPVLWFAPWGYLLASILFLLSAIGILLVYYERVRANLKNELQARKKMSEALAESKLLLDSVVEGATDAIFLKDTNGNTFW